MTTHPHPSHGSKSPTCGGFRGPTPPQPTTHKSATALKSPQHLGDVGGPPRTHTASFSTPEQAYLGKKERKLKTANQT